MFWCDIEINGASSEYFPAKVMQLYECIKHFTSIIHWRSTPEFPIWLKVILPMMILQLALLISTIRGSIPHPIPPRDFHPSTHPLMAPMWYIHLFSYTFFHIWWYLLFLQLVTWHLLWKADLLRHATQPLGNSQSQANLFHRLRFENFPHKIRNRMGNQAFVRDHVWDYFIKKKLSIFKKNMASSSRRKLFLSNLFRPS